MIVYIFNQGIKSNTYISYLLISYIITLYWQIKILVSYKIIQLFGIFLKSLAINIDLDRGHQISFILFVPPYIYLSLY